jgi:glutamine amidotransferase
VIAIVDYGMGNKRSVEKALEHVGAQPRITADHDEIRAAAAVILPGVGAFPEAMRRLRASGLDRVVADVAGSGTPLLGICLGMQLLFEGTTELGGAEGLGLLEGQVDMLAADGLKVPQIGWNPVSWRGDTPLREGLPDPCAFYHVHSFAPRPLNEDDVAGTATYGSEFVSVVQRPPLYGVQFHPEKSGPDGLRLLRSFAALCSPVTA